MAVRENILRYGPLRHRPSSLPCLGTGWCDLHQPSGLSELYIKVLSPRKHRLTFSLPSPSSTCSHLYRHYAKLYPKTVNDLRITDAVDAFTVTYSVTQNDGSEGCWYLSVYAFFPEVAKIHPITAFTHRTQNTVFFGLFKCKWHDIFISRLLHSSSRFPFFLTFDWCLVHSIAWFNLISNRSTADNLMLDK